MKVTLIDYTGFGSKNPSRHAANLMAFTKSTRLEMNPGLMDEIASWPDEKMKAELTYMANTIPSSWEFCNYTFLITDVTRAFTHQFVRTRQGSYAQQTMRVLDKKGWTYGTGPSVDSALDEWSEGCGELYHETMKGIARAYDKLVANGVAIEDARGILPTNIHTNIVAQFNLRTLAEMFRKRASGRTQGEYRDVIQAMKAEVCRAHDWAPIFLGRSFDVSAKELELKVRELQQRGFSAAEVTDMVKLIDQMRMQA